MELILFFVKFWESEPPKSCFMKDVLSTVRIRRCLCYRSYTRFMCAGDGVLCTVQCHLTLQVPWEHSVVCSLSFNGNYPCLTLGKQFLSDTADEQVEVIEMDCQLWFPFSCTTAVPLNEYVSALWWARIRKSYLCHRGWERY